MTISMYDAAVKPALRMMANLATLLEKGEQSALARKIGPEVLVNARLAPDMFPLSRQVQIASDTAKMGCARLAGVAPPAFEDKEKTLPELVERVRRTIAFLETLTPQPFEGAEEREIRWKSPVAGERSMQGLNYLLHQLLPNLHFHCTTAYDILRHNGVELGKMDYLGRVPPA
jgi:uncharacterized protein